MRRILLAFLALLGLAAQVAPVQARVCGAGMTEIGVAAPLRGAPRALAARTAIAAQAATRTEPRLDGCNRTILLKRPQVYVPTVQMGIDRAHE